MLIFWYNTKNQFMKQEIKKKKKKAKLMYKSATQPMLKICTGFSHLKKNKKETKLDVILECIISKK